MTRTKTRTRMRTSLKRLMTDPPFLPAGVIITPALMQLSLRAQILLLATTVWPNDGVTVTSPCKCRVEPVPVFSIGRTSGQNHQISQQPENISCERFIRVLVRLRSGYRKHMTAGKTARGRENPRSVTAQEDPAPLINTGH